MFSHRKRRRGIVQSKVLRKASERRDCLNDRWNQEWRELEVHKVSSKARTEREENKWCCTLDKIPKSDDLFLLVAQFVFVPKVCGTATNALCVVTNA